VGALSWRGVAPGKDLPRLRRDNLRIGILGGTFDPIHLGHLIVAEEVRIKLELPKILFIPAGNPWLRRGPVTPAKHRLEMVRLAIKPNPFFELSNLEVERPGPSYTVDTLLTLREKFGQESEFYFIIGPDALAELPKWKSPEKLIRLCWLVAVRRPGAPEVKLSELEEAIPGLSSRLVLVDEPRIGISSTDIRERVAEGFSIRYLVPDEVQTYIYRHRLYLKGEV